MINDLLADMGPVFIGSRLKRLAERIQADAARIVRSLDLDFQPSQLTLLAAIDRHGSLTVGEAVDAIGFSQPAITRSLSVLVERGLAETTVSDSDRRQKAMRLTVLGKRTCERVRAEVWPGLGMAVSSLIEGLSGPFLEQVAQIEAGLDHLPLDRRFAAAGLEIVEYAPDLARDFHDINAEWIEAMFEMEPADRETIENPDSKIITPGGAILFVRAPGFGIVGTCALRNAGDGAFELTKMGVRESARGMKAGEFLLDAAIERARAMPIDTLYLLTNSKCAAAIHLYEKAGFVHDPEIMAKYSARYARANVAMRFPL